MSKELTPEELTEKLEQEKGSEEEKSPRFRFKKRKEKKQEEHSDLVTALKNMNNAWNVLKKELKNYGFKI